MIEICIESDRQREIIKEKDTKKEIEQKNGFSESIQTEETMMVNEKFTEKN